MTPLFFDHPKQIVHWFALAGAAWAGAATAVWAASPLAPDYSIVFHNPDSEQYVEGRHVIIPTTTSTVIRAR